MTDANAEATTPKPRFKLPPTIILLTMILVVAAIAVQIVPPGQFDRAERTVLREGTTEISVVVEEGDTPATIRKRTYAAESELPDSRALTPGEEITLTVPNTGTRTVVVPGSFSRTERRAFDGPHERAGAVIGAVATAPLRGFEDKSAVIAFILIIGGAFGIILKTGAIDAVLRSAVERLGASGHGWAVIVGCMVMFSLGGAAIGMSEETIPFVLITIPIALRMGYDTITGVGMCYIGAHLGFAAAFLNPFTVGVAQGIAEVPVFSGIGFRMIAWVVITSIGIGYVLWWAGRVRRNPEISPVAEIDRQRRAELAGGNGTIEPQGRRARWSDYGVLAVVVMTLVTTAWGVKMHDWYLTELSGVFFIAGVVVAILARLEIATAAGSFVRGASDLTGAALIVAFSAGIVLVLQDGQVLDTILNGIAGLVEGQSPIVGSWLMFLFQSVLNFFVPSGSGQAAMTMPIMAPLGDLIGVPRQTAVLAFQFGDGFSNMIIPTSAVLMGVLGIARIPWETWARWIMPLQLILVTVGCVFLAIAVTIGYR